MRIEARDTALDLAVVDMEGNEIGMARASLAELTEQFIKIDMNAKAAAEANKEPQYLEDFYDWLKTKGMAPGISNELIGLLYMQTRQHLVEHQKKTIEKLTLADSGRPN